MSCLFNSLSHFVPESSEQIRSTICDFLEQDNILFDDVKSSDVTQWESDKDLKGYVANMRNQSVWGGACEIKAFCEIWGKAVEVYTPAPHIRRVANFIPSTPYTQTVRLRWSGSHYDPQPQRDFDVFNNPALYSLPQSFSPFPEANTERRVVTRLPGGRIVNVRRAN